MGIQKLVFFLLIVSIAACNKDINTVPEVMYKGGPMVSFNNYKDDDGNGYYKYEASLKDSFIMANIEVKLTNTTEEAKEDISIYLKKVDALVTDYNTANSTNLTPVSNTSPALIYDFSKPLILRKGQRKITVPILLNSLKLDLSKTNAMGIAIERVIGAELSSGPESKVVVEFNAVNQYHGEYKSNGYFYHPTVPRSIDDLIKFGATAGPNSIIFELGDLGAAGYLALFTINGTSVTITPAPGAAGAPYTMFSAGLPSTNPGYTPAWIGSASSNNTYDPVTKTFSVRYGYMGSGGWRVTEEKIVKQ